MKEIFESISKYWRFVKEQKYALYDCTSTSVDKKWQKNQDWLSFENFIFELFF